VTRKVRYSRLVFLGPPASGKGTQAALISRAYAIPTASTGAMLRDERARGTPLGREVDKITRGGGLAPDDVVLKLVSRWLDRNERAFLFDGFPRTLAQAERFSDDLARREVGLDRVLLLELDQAEIEHRVLDRVTCKSCGATFSTSFHDVEAGKDCPVCSGPLGRRSDDSLESLQNRLKQYEELTSPVIDFYDGKELLVRMDAGVGRDALFQNLCELIAGPREVSP